MSGKGSSPRPFSVDRVTFESNWAAIFEKNKMSPSTEQMKKGTCGCGRSPTGNCIGWHGLSKEVYEQKLREYRQQVEVTPEEEEAWKSLEKRN